jgi:hypothetical protein
VSRANLRYWLGGISAVGKSDVVVAGVAAGGGDGSVVAGGVEPAQAVTRSAMVRSQATIPMFLSIRLVSGIAWCPITSLLTNVCSLSFQTMYSANNQQYSARSEQPSAVLWLSGPCRTRAHVGHLCQVSGDGILSV